MTTRQTIIFTIAALVMSSTSHALVADRFKCTLEVKDLASEVSTKVQKMFFIARLPLSASSAPDIRLTAGQTPESLTLDSPKAVFVANLNFYYKHAVKIDVNGSPLEARQLSCIALHGSYCEKPAGGGGIQTCSHNAFPCSEPQNPFDPNNGWSLTRLVDGIPIFTEQTLGPATANIPDNNGNIVGVVNLNCQYMGTFQ